MTQKSLFQSKAELQGGLSSEFATFNLIPQFSCNWVFLQTPSGPLTLSSTSLSTTNAIVPFSVHRSNYFLNTAHCGLFKRAVGWINTKLCGRRTSVFKTFMCHFCKEKKKKKASTCEFVPEYSRTQLFNLVKTSWIGSAWGFSSPPDLQVKSPLKWLERNDIYCKISAVIQITVDNKRRAVLKKQLCCGSHKPTELLLREREMQTTTAQIL